MADVAGHFDGLTPSQTVGPFFHGSLRERGVLAGPGAAGERILLALRLLDGEGAPVSDGMVEIWQADAAGRYPHPLDPRHGDADPAFLHHGRLAVDAEGFCVFETVKPGVVGARVAGSAMPPDGGSEGGATDSGSEAAQAPHVDVQVMARGLLRALVTRVYFDGDAGNTTDPILSLVPPARRDTLLARRMDGDRPDVTPASGPARWELTIRLSGAGETVFFDV